MAAVFLICGKICSGKSTFAQKLAKENSAVILSCDEIMTLFPQPEGDEAYAAVSEKVKACLLNKAAQIASCGANVILDWGFWHRKERAEISAFFAEKQIPFTWYYLDIPVKNGCLGDFGAYVGEELVQVTREMFPLSHRREDTFISGMSMGGYGALRNGLKYHDTFGGIAVFAGAVHFYEYDRDWVNTQGNTRGELENFRGLDETENTDRNPRHLIREIRKQNVQDGVKHFPRIYMTCGTEDALLGANEALAAALKEAGAEVEWHPCPGRHDAAFCNDRLPDVIRWLNIHGNQKS